MSESTKARIENLIERLQKGDQDARDKLTDCAHGLAARPTNDEG